MDFEWISRLQKSLDELYILKSQALLNAKEYGDIREAQGFVKAISTFGKLIAENNDIPGKE